MHHFFEAITNINGDSLVGYFGRVIDPTSQQVVPIYADDNGTPIITTSEVANMAKTDDAGNLDFFVEPGTYHIDLYDQDALTFIRRVSNYPMTSQQGAAGPPGPPGPPGEPAPLFPAGTVFITKAQANDAIATISENTVIQVLQDESKSNTVAVYRKVSNALFYLYSVSNTFDARPPATGVFFDSATQPFTALSTPSSGALTVSAGSIAFNSSTPVTLDASVRDRTGNILSVCFDYATVDMTLTLNSFPEAGALGVVAAMPNTSGGLFGGAVSAGGAGPGFILPSLIGQNAGRATAGNQQPFTGPYQVRARYSREGATARLIVNYAGEPDVVGTYQMDLGKPATSNELPRLFSTMGVRFSQADAVLTALKVSAAYPNARFGLMGTSLTQGRFASSYANGWAQQFRAARAPTTVMVAGAPSATAVDWRTRTAGFTAMGPAIAIVELGTNDILTDVSDADFKAAMTSIVSDMAGAGITPIVLTIPPLGTDRVVTWNTWIKAQGWQVIDIYPVLVTPGSNTLKASSDSGDGIHWNDTGHADVFNAVNNGLLALGL